ncbi:glycosyltransferase family 8 protein [Actinokineospora sp. NBRC 105648]|uniref:glycosyltransferase family 8 protein n=1 Tax=Actinokineospora sp. NBRC 105648 TaxID=3032206 RepID=UPI0024A3AF74|nr:glycosyltransferase family 8 protein [Actinokineospora sp. NBRC 105648]GLZ38117.1 general stress protein A [Actinokineospora sp. NBRC 105648]
MPNPQQHGAHAEIVFAIDDNYVRPAAVAARSIRAGLRDPAARPRFHIIDGGLSAAGRTEVAERVGAHGDVLVHRLTDMVRLPQEMIKHWTSSALGRLYVGDVLPADVHRAVYLDVDTLVLGDLTELLDVDLGGRTLGASLNEVGGERSWRLGETAVYSDHGAEAPGYFNSGVLLIDVDRWRADGVTARAVELYRRYGDQFRTHDQDVLNILFSGDWVPFPEKWNKLVEHSVHGRFGNGRLDYLTEPDGLVHFIGGVKPWHDEFPPNSLRALYREYQDAEYPRSSAA